MDILVKVRVAEGVEMEVRGGPDVFNAALGELPNMVSKLRSALAPTTTVPAQPERPAPTIDVEHFPSIEKPRGTQDAIYKVVSSSWGKVRPRTAKEIDPVLKANGVHISEGSLTGSLTLLVQAGKLRRLKVGSSYAYTLPLSSNGN
ncbi:MAG TPA: hypothetical protein VNW25_01325 [Candidatus Sulfotelmatobacter sp.]|nr:hypothetical protein [Candidatus Sulfotelmatobacter sp.]